MAATWPDRRIPISFCRTGSVPVRPSTARFARAQDEAACSMPYKTYLILRRPRSGRLEGRTAVLQSIFCSAAPVPRRDLGGEPQRRDQAVRPGNALPGDVEGGAVIG